MKVEIVVMENGGSVPSKGSTDAAGFDLHSNEDYTLEPKQRHLFKLGIRMAIPEGYYGQIAPRSGLAYKYGIQVLAGVIDSDYRGEVGVILYNSGDKALNVAKYDRIAQMLFKKVESPILVECLVLDETTRGIGGFGSTG